jgi:hypothetical protein
VSAISPQRLAFARELADPNFSLSVPDVAKHVILDLLAEIDRLTGTQTSGQRLVAEIKRLREENPGLTLADARAAAETNLEAIA